MYVTTTAEARMRDLPPDRGRQRDRDRGQPLSGQARRQKGQDRRRGDIFTTKGLLTFAGSKNKAFPRLRDSPLVRDLLLDRGGESCNL